MKTDPALAGTAGARMLHAVTFKNLDVTIIHYHRKRDCQSPLRVGENAMRVGIEFQQPRGGIELFQRHGEYISFFHNTLPLFKTAVPLVGLL